MRNEATVPFAGAESCCLGSLWCLQQSCHWLVFEDVHTSVFFHWLWWSFMMRRVGFPITPVRRTHCWTCGRASVRILLPPSSSGTQLAFWLVETSRKRARVVRVQADQLLHKPTATTRYSSRLPKKILRPRLCSKLWAYGEIGTNPRSLLPHLKSHSFQIFRKYSAEGIGVRMAAYKLVLIRHGESSWNQENRFCGWFDADLSETGQQEAKRGGQALKGTR